jgi:hypothetical protein
MLHACQNQLSQEPEEIQARVYLKQADMRDFSLGQLFKLVTIPFRPFQHLITVKDQLACLECVHHHLIEDGRLVFDVSNPSLELLTSQDTGEEIGDEPEFTTPNSRSVIRWHKIVSRDRLKQINHVELIYYVTHPEGQEERLVHPFPMRYMFRFELEHILTRSGFETE